MLFLLRIVIGITTIVIGSCLYLYLLFQENRK
jgi:hypothetical protein